MNEFDVFGAVALTLLMMHGPADYFVQTDHQAQHKGLTGDRSAEGRWNAAKHALSYTVTQAIAVVLVLAVFGFDGSYAVVVAGLVLNGLTHYVIDRRWTLEVFARRVMRKSGWIDNDPGALPHLDQAAHLGLFFPVALLIAALA
jgi:hypothetical protein